MLGESGFALTVFEVAQVFPEAGVEWPACLTCVLLVAGGAGDLVYPRFLIFAFMGWVVVSHQKFLYCVFGGISDFDLGALEGFNYSSCFFAVVGESGPEWFFRRGFVFVEIACGWGAGVLYPLLCRICCIMLTSFCLLSGGTW